MTVSYQYDVNSNNSSSGFLRLLLRWRGSVWKLVYTELAVLACIYLTLTLLYTFAFTQEQRHIFEEIVRYCSSLMGLIPLSFLLGFYVTFVAERWWSQYKEIPWPDNMANIIALYIPGTDDETRLLRRTLMRYVNLTIVLMLRSISPAVKKRFPSDEYLVDFGLMTKAEMGMFNSVPRNPFNMYWVPSSWFINLLRTATEKGSIAGAHGTKLIIEEMNSIRSKCRMLYSYDWVSVPLVYTQVVTLATYMFFLAALFGRQPIENGSPIKPLEYFPALTIMEYFLYMGLLKVAEELINPFGEDDEDFEVNYLIDRHIKVSNLGVDLLCGPPPPLESNWNTCQLDNTFYHPSETENKFETYFNPSACTDERITPSAVSDIASTLRKNSVKTNPSLTIPVASTSL